MRRYVRNNSIEAFRSVLKPLIWGWLVAAVAGPVMPQHASHEASGKAAAVPEAILEVPIGIHTGTGRTHQRVSTSSQQAQAFYDQGLSYLHSYVWIDAARSFHQALRMDSHLAMAYLGLADAEIGLQDVGAARSACEQAEALKQYMTAGEQGWLTIRDREVRFLESPDEQSFAAYVQAIEDAIKASPRDPWLLVQRGLATESSPFTHGQASGAASLPYYKRALAIDPGNLAAFHYEIHANENMGNIKAALDESTVYARLAFSIPHAHHMRGHELMRTGRTLEAIEEFQKTDQLEKNYYATEKIPPQYDWHHAHNLQLLAMNYALLGQHSKAEKLLREAFSLPAYTEFLAYNRRAWPEFLIGRGRYEEALQACRKLAESPWPMARMAAHSLEGEAALGLDRSDDAKQELAIAARDAEQLPERVASISPYPAVLKAAILLREGRTEEGESIYVNVEKAATSMPGPDGWIAAVFLLESIARDAREAGDWELSQYTAEQMIKHDPYYAGGHYAFGLVAEHAGEPEGAREMFQQAVSLWSHGDRDLAELVTARRKLAASQ